MRGLIWKDVLVMRKTLRTYALFMLFYLLLTAVGAFQVSFIAAMIQVIVMMLPIGAFSYDEAAKWDRYAAALPVGRRSIVAGRYLFTLLMALSAAVFSLAACLVLHLLGRAELAESVVSMLVSLGLGLFIAEVILPLSYRLGPERARPWLYAVVFLPILLLFGGYKLGLLDKLDLSWLDRLSGAAVCALFGLIPLLALAGLAASYLISCRIVARKEF